MHSELLQLLNPDSCIDVSRGLELQDYPARAGKRIPIVFVTGRANESDENRAMEGGAVTFLRKPFSEQALFDAIERALSR